LTTTTVRQKEEEIETITANPSSDNDVTLSADLATAGLHPSFIRNRLLARISRENSIMIVVDYILAMNSEMYIYLTISNMITF
jgi:hypothetical protein